MEIDSKRPALRERDPQLLTLGGNCLTSQVSFFGHPHRKMSGELQKNSRVFVGSRTFSVRCTEEPLIFLAPNVRSCEIQPCNDFDEPFTQYRCSTIYADHNISLRVRSIRLHRRRDIRDQGSRRNRAEISSVTGRLDAPVGA